jgi:hypothetical protein
MTTSTPREPLDESVIVKGLDLYAAAGRFFETRLLGIPSGNRTVTAAGWFQDTADAAKLLALRDGFGQHYVTLNPVREGVETRAFARIQENPKALTGDNEIARRHRLLLDFDPKRPSGISSTDAEHDAAIERAKNTARHLQRVYGWHPLAIIDSGNGAHVLYGIDLPNDNDARDLVKHVLEALDASFGDDQIDVDRTVFNAARIVKIPGTLAQKGDATPDRPHRRSCFLYENVNAAVVTRAKLETVAALRPIEEPHHRPMNGQVFDLDGFISRNGLSVRSSSAYGGGSRHILEECVFDPTHTGSSAAVFQMSSGALVYKCQHNSCADRKWSDVREKFEPGYRDRVALPMPTRAANGKPSTGSLTLRDLRSVRFNRVRWFEYNMIPLAELTLVNGDGGLGKTTFLLDLIARASAGRAMPSGLKHDRPQRWLIVAEEDRHGILRARLDVAGADHDNIRLVESVGAERDYFTFPAHTRALHDAIVAGGWDGVLIDNLLNHLDDDINASKPQDMRRGLRPLIEVAHETGVPISAVRHIGKSAGPASTRGFGSAEARNLSRSELTVALHPDQEAHEGLVMVALSKANLSPDRHTTMAFRLASEDVVDDDGEPTTIARVDWEVAPPVISADDLLDQPSAVERDERTAAADWLRCAVTQDERRASEVCAEGVKAGHSRRTIYRARSLAGIVSNQRGFPRQAYWSLSCQVSPIGERGTTGGFGTPGSPVTLDEARGVPPKASGPVLPLSRAECSGCGGRAELSEAGLCERCAKPKREVPSRAEVALADDDLGDPAALWGGP